MSALDEINSAWRSAFKRYCHVTLKGQSGAYRPIKDKFATFLDDLWLARGDCLLPDLGAMLAAGRDVRVFGDPHFEHANIIGLAGRPFATVEEMDRQLWQFICQAHVEADFVLCLGDLSLKNPIHWQRELFNKFGGKQLTVVGNHDMRNSKSIQWTQAGGHASLAFQLDRALVRSWVEAREPEKCGAIDWMLVPQTICVGVSHWPVPPSHLPGPQWVNLHGHSHSAPSRCLRINASLEQISYKPRRIADLIDARIVNDLILRQQGIEFLPDDSDEKVSGL